MPVVAITARPTAAGLPVTVAAGQSAPEAALRLPSRPAERWFSQRGGCQLEYLAPIIGTARHASALAGPNLDREAGGGKSAPNANRVRTRCEQAVFVWTRAPGDSSRPPVKPPITVNLNPALLCDSKVISRALLEM